MKTPQSKQAKEPTASRETPAPEQVQQWLSLARLLRPQGRKGEILAELFTDFPESFETRKRVFVAPPGFSGEQSAARPAEVVAWWLPLGKNEGRIVLHLAGIDSINAAEPLCGFEVIVPASERSELDQDSTYVSDLIGCTVFDLANADQRISIGTVIDVHFAATPDGGRRLDEAAPLLAVETATGDEVLIPFVKAFILSLDPEHKRIEMALPLGLLEVNLPS